MNYRFVAEAEDEWRKLDNSIKQQFKSALAKRLENPRIPSAVLHNMPDCYKIKLRKIGYRLVYRVDDNVLTVTVIAIGKRDKSVVYDVANSRL
ncbi:type II toxin-antitoxin system RelE family toxin [Kingella negevensis]|uniref:type II toxin-antitoxin system RelE family toxin n=1 Tax=Kingella negevensis TaxID=1522312 RepID=UPI00254D91A1|nr:type II toxin-antitoxin system RelE/ParE family toxin [Kingella negevensis]MDK4681227.1 type II toxin-antitoxin system RelE/ParE family toxin [Kingella negevensis]MDK4683424.1 type II toxin-antitoxin system RelE/ParE family toxin [Kingella negevensis]MDK4691441.1 type II toxin-antitoxin system RelE/ParE family toxin [Kingella negevensis]MDK4693410.1 type II toxin-antitoxin system RelE/ParE family toxin [Kingella negevensis]MDK4700023.1 type II toxin-antitoxin system RelE/ParE family toxin [